MTLTRKLFIAVLAAALLPAGQALASEGFYSPYRTCMANCQTEEETCIEHIDSSESNPDELRAGCTSKKEACVQECSYLPIPPEGAVEPPKSEPQQAEPQPDEAPKAEEVNQTQEGQQETPAANPDTAPPNEAPQHTEGEAEAQ